MSSGFYSKLAISNLKKNARFYIPRILTETGLLGSFYIMLAITFDEQLTKIKGGAYLPTIMSIGLCVMVILTTILMLYTNSFLMKQRKREFGLYNILGMEKRHVVRVLMHESIVSSISSVITGTIFGMLFYKLCSLGICKLLNAEVVLGSNFFSIISLGISAAFFIGLDLAIFFFNCITVARLKPVEMLASSHTGEKEPKVKWVLLVIGLATMAYGYYIALSTQSPLRALNSFFGAVILVVIGTYCLFVAGSIWILKLLKANKKFYYHRRHMPAVSGLLYRMKQNAVGLASITILATGVLVMISTTVSLYSGMNITMDEKYREQLYVETAYFDKDGQLKHFPTERVKEIVEKSAAKYDLKIDDCFEQEFTQAAYYLDGNILTVPEDGNSKVDMTSPNIVYLISISQQEYEKLTGKSLNLSEGEVAVYNYETFDQLSAADLNFRTTSCRVAKRLSAFPIGSNYSGAIGTYGIVFADRDSLEKVTDEQELASEGSTSFNKRVAFVIKDLKKYQEVGVDMMKEDVETLQTEMRAMPDFDDTKASTVAYDSYSEARELFLGMFGSLLFLGILLGIIFMFATALIIYYKQISEGYEDANRFQIMEKIGMSRAEVRKTIKTQILLVFFLPIIVAGIHMCVASPILLKMLHIFYFTTDSLYYTCAGIVFVIFVILYTCIYLGTAKTYYKIVR